MSAVEELPVFRDFHGISCRGKPLVECRNVYFMVKSCKMIFHMHIYIYIYIYSDSRFNLAPLHCTERLIQPAG